MSLSLNPLFAGIIVLEWIIRIVMLFVVPKRQRPSSANAWLLLIMIAPTLGTLLFFTLGSPKLPRLRMKKRQEVDALTKRELEELQAQDKTLFASIKNDDYRTLADLATYLGGLPPMNGNKVEFIDEYEKSLNALVTEVEKAEDHVHVQYFIAVLDNTTRPLITALGDAVKRGVKVRFLYDRVLSRNHYGHKQLRAKLDKIGVDHHEMLPLSLIPGKNFTRPDLRNHRKIAVIDGKVAFSGSQNIIDKTYHRNDDIVYEEVVVKMQGPIVWQCNNVFRSDWFAETGEPLLDVVEDQDMPPQVGKIPMQVLPSGPSHDHENNLKIYTSMVHAAKKTVGIVVPYFIPDESFLDAVTGAAQRGVEVTLINSEAIDKTFAGYAQRSYYDELLDAGVNVYLYKEPVFLHTKHVVIDESVAIVGSSNLDMRSFELDLEVSIILYDKAVSQQLTKIEKGYLENANRITKESWRSRALKSKMMESIARLTSALQ